MAAKSSGNSKAASGGGKAGSGKTTIKGGKGKAPVSFQKGGLHKSLGVPQGQTIPAEKMAAAKAGDYGPVAQAQANLATGMLAKGRQTVAKNRAAKGKSGGGK
jgi:hypothetical protein